MTAPLMAVMMAVMMAVTMVEYLDSWMAALTVAEMVDLKVALMDYYWADLKATTRVEYLVEMMVRY